MMVTMLEISLKVLESISGKTKHLIKDSLRKDIWMVKEYGDRIREIVMRGNIIRI